MARPLEVARVVNASASDAWALLIDTRRWPEWGPSIRAVHSPTRFIALGARGRVLTAAGVWVRFEVVRFENGRRWSWRVGGVLATGHRVESLGPRRCRVVFEVPLAALPYALVCRLALRRIEHALARSPIRT